MSTEPDIVPYIYSWHLSISWIKSHNGKGYQVSCFQKYGIVFISRRLSQIYKTKNNWTSIKYFLKLPTCKSIKLEKRLVFKHISYMSHVYIHMCACMHKKCKRISRVALQNTHSSGRSQKHNTTHCIIPSMCFQDRKGLGGRKPVSGYQGGGTVKGREASLGWRKHLWN